MVLEFFRDHKCKMYSDLNKRTIFSIHETDQTRPSTFGNWAWDLQDFLQPFCSKTAHFSTSCPLTLLYVRPQMKTKNKLYIFDEGNKMQFLFSRFWHMILILWDAFRGENASLITVETARWGNYLWPYKQIKKKLCWHEHIHLPNQIIWMAALQKAQGSSE